MAIVDIHGNPFSVARTLEHQQTADPRVMAATNDMATHPSRRLTPRKLQAIFQEAENGNLIAQADLFMDMEEQDSQIFADFQKRKLVLTTLEKRVVPLEDATPAEVAEAEYLNKIIQSLDGWEDLIMNMADGIGQGFSNQEIGWELYQREWYPSRFDWRPASWFTFDPAKPDTVLLRTDDTNGVPLRRFSWISHKPKSRSGYFVRAGIMRTLAWPYLYRCFGAQGLTEMLEIYGLPIRIGKYPAGSGESERSALMRAVTTLGRNGGGIMPDTMKMEIHNAVAGSSDPYMRLAEWAEKSISKTILGGTLTSQADGKTSTNALGLIHNEVRLDIMAADARQLATTLRSDLLYPLLYINRNPQADPRRTPRLVFPELDEMRRQAKQDKRDTAETRVSVSFNRPPAAPSAIEQARTALVQLAQRQTPDEPPGEAGISDALAKLLASDAPQEQIAQILEPALNAIAGTLTADEMLGALAEAFPQMNVAPLASQLGDYMAIARYIGQFAAQQEQ
jgi:phage gp29-like protein